ncbi:MAG TPA: hypothetical protein VFO76_07070, partial [Candidatus Kapabacteria bacterium]|nr:hypothetical protein [Candidatus Kapabacteria bacterium]
FSFIHSEGTSKWYQYFLPILFCIRSILLAVFLYTTATPIKLDRYRVDVGEYVPATVPYTWRDLGRWLDDHETFTTVIKISDSVSIKKIDSYRTEIHTSFSQPQQITFNLFYWPQWKLRRTDRTEIPASADSEGRLTALIPAGNQFINLQLEKSTSEKIGAIISLVALSLVGMIAYVFRIKREK